MINLWLLEILPTESDMKQWVEKYGEEQAKEMVNNALALLGSMSREDMIADLQRMSAYLSMHSENQEV